MLNEILAGLKTLVQGPASGGTGEKRRLIRMKCRYKVTCSIEREAFMATVVDMGLQGLRLETPHRLKVGQAAYVTYNSDSPAFSVDTVKCQVAWARKTRSGKLEAGLRYDDTKANLERSWVRVILREMGFDEKSIFQRRRERRAVAMLPAQVGAPGLRAPLAARVLNLGVGGALLATEDRLEKGQEVALDIGPGLGLPVLAVAGEVVTWRYEPASQNWFSGVRFRNLSGKHLDLLSRYLVKLLKEAPE